MTVKNKVNFETLGLAKGMELIENITKRLGLNKRALKRAAKIRLPSTALAFQMMLAQNKDSLTRDLGSEFVEKAIIFSEKFVQQLSPRRGGLLGWFSPAIRESEEAEKITEIHVDLGVLTETDLWQRLVNFKGEEGALVTLDELLFDLENRPFPLKAWGIHPWLVWIDYLGQLLQSWHPVVECLEGSTNATLEELVRHRWLSKDSVLWIKDHLTSQLNMRDNMHRGVEVSWITADGMIKSADRLGSDSPGVILRTRQNHRLRYALAPLLNLTPDNFRERLHPLDLPKFWVDTLRERLRGAWASKEKITLKPAVARQVESFEIIFNAVEKLNIKPKVLLEPLYQLADQERILFGMDHEDFAGWERLLWQAMAHFLWSVPLKRDEYALIYTKLTFKASDEAIFWDQEQTLIVRRLFLASFESLLASDLSHPLGLNISDVYTWLCTLPTPWGWRLSSEKRWNSFYEDMELFTLMWTGGEPEANYLKLPNPSTLADGAVVNPFSEDALDSLWLMVADSELAGVGPGCYRLKNAHTNLMACFDTDLENRFVLGASAGEDGEEVRNPNYPFRQKLPGSPGNHTVHPVTLPNGHKLWLRLFPENAPTDHAVTTLCDAWWDGGTPCNTLVHVVMGDPRNKNRISIPVEVVADASHGFEECSSHNLHDLYLSFDDVRQSVEAELPSDESRCLSADDATTVLKRISQKSWTQSLLRVLLLNPADDKPDDYILVMKPEGADLVKVDNDRLWMDNLVTTKKRWLSLRTTRSTGVKTVILMMPQLMDPAALDHDTLYGFHCIHLQQSLAHWAEHAIGRNRAIYATLFSSDELKRAFRHKLYYVPEASMVSFPSLLGLAIPPGFMKRLLVHGLLAQFWLAEALRDYKSSGSFPLPHALVRKISFTLADYYQQWFEGSEESRGLPLIRFHEAFVKQDPYYRSLDLSKRMSSKPSLLSFNLEGDRVEGMTPEILLAGLNEDQGKMPSDHLGRAVVGGHQLALVLKKLTGDDLTSLMGTYLIQHPDDHMLEVYERLTPASQRGLWDWMLKKINRAGPAKTSTTTLVMALKMGSYLPHQSLQPSELQA